MRRGRRAIRQSLNPYFALFETWHGFTYTTFPLRSISVFTEIQQESSRNDRDVLRGEETWGGLTGHDARQRTRVVRVSGSGGAEVLKKSGIRQVWEKSRDGIRGPSVQDVSLLV